MSYDINNMNLDIINHHRQEFLREYNSFINKTYNTFLSGHLNDFSDPYIKLMISKLDMLYKNISNSYDLILNFLDDYIKNASSLELFLSGDANTSCISEGILRNYAEGKLNKFFK